VAERIEQVEGFEQRIMQARLEAGNCLEGLTRLGRELSEERRACITPIEGQVQGMLRQLGMPNGRFVISFTQRPLPGPSGFDEVRFLFSANKQQQPDELGKVASGGEMSRLMLSIKATVAEKMILPYHYFRRD
jgi:DNA repair protein RecN (Recombination protein N)